MHVLKRSFPALMLGATLVGSMTLALPAFAADSGPHSFIRPVVMGTVATTPDASGTFTVTSKMFQRDASSSPSTTYTINTTSATTVTKNGASSSVSAIAAGDMVMVQGSVSGTSVTATSIRDGMMMRGGRPGTPGAWNGHASSTPPTPPIQGNGEPVIGGTVSVISGSTLTVTAKAGQTYTVDASSAIISKRGVTGATVSSISAGDRVIVQGTVNGTSVAASSVLDSAPPPAGGNGADKPAPHGFFGAIGGFFSHLFGFF